MGVYVLEGVVLNFNGDNRGACETGTRDKGNTWYSGMKHHVQRD